MAHFGYTVPQADWVSGYTPAAATFAAMDAKIYKCINGDEGGTWAPSAAIVIGGQGVTISATLAINGSASGVISLTSGSKIHGAWAWDTATCTGTLGWGSTGLCQFNSSSGATWKSGSSLLMEASSSATFGGASTVTGGWTFNAQTTTFDSSSTVDVGGVFELTSTSTPRLKAPMVASGVGRRVKRYVGLGTRLDSSVTKGINDGDVFMFAASAGRTLTLSATDALAGDEIRVFNSTMNTVSVVDQASSNTIGSVDITGGASHGNMVLAVFDGTNWVWAGTGAAA